jgi:hypothetical protein
MLENTGVVFAHLQYPIVVPFPDLTNALRDALDSIAAFSLKNPEWAVKADFEGIPVPPPPRQAIEKARREAEAAAAAAAAAENSGSK